MRLFSAFLVGSVLAQERLPAAQTACAAFRDEIKANNTIAGDGVWQCPKLSKETKKASFKVKCGIEKDVNGTVTPTPSWSDSIKQKPADGTLACHENLCSVGTENDLIAKGSLLHKGKRSKGGFVTEFYVLKCKNEKKPRKGAIKCVSNTGVFSSEKNPDYKTACEPAVEGE